jgi:CheY-like chemotaxis protein
MKVPVHYHPTTTVLVDDSDTFLRSLTFQLDPAQASISFHDTVAALEWFGNSARSPELPLQVHVDDPYQSAGQRNVAVDLARIWRISARPERVAIPSVLVVDYSMPQMDGVSFCEALRQLPCKKILFTGAADEKIAVDAFNRGLIDRYIKKSADDALDQLERELAVLQREFFIDQSEPLCHMLALHDFSFLNCGCIANVVADLYRMHGFVEHYIFPNPSGILFFDRAGKATLMIIETEQGLQAQYEMARDSRAPHSLLAALEERRVLPFFAHDGMYSDAIGEQWHRYTRTPEVCMGSEIYYWALFELDPAFLA